MRMSKLLYRWYEITPETKGKLLTAAAAAAMMFFLVMPLMSGRICSETFTGEMELKVYSLLECYPLGLMVVAAPLLNIVILLQNWDAARKRKWYIRTAIVFFLCFGICTLKMWNWLQGNAEGSLSFCRAGVIYPLLYALCTAGIMTAGSREGA